MEIRCVPLTDAVWRDDRRFVDAAGDTFDASIMGMLAVGEPLRPHDKLPKDDMVLWWLGCFIEKQHPEVKLPKMTKRERAQRTTRYQHKAKAAVIATMRALLRPTNVRDLDFNIYGRDNIDVAPGLRQAQLRSAVLLNGSSTCSA